MATTARLPGIQFEVVSTPVVETLVRLDIAAFAGFAACGPVNLPVAVEAISDFEDIFGADLQLALDDSGNPLYAYLAPTVRAFFRNGGRRCWIVRLAGSTAVANQFSLPGLSLLQGSSLTPASAIARSPGDWSDGLAVSTALRSQAVPATHYVEGSDSIRLSLTGSVQLGIGDLLRITSAAGAVHWLFLDFIIPDTTNPASSLPPNRATRAVMASGSVSYDAPPSSPPNSLVSSSTALPICEVLTMDLFVRDDRGQIWSLTELGFSPLHPRYWASLPDDLTLYQIDSPTGLAAESIHPRFPLAGPPSTEQRYFIPDSIGPLPTSFRGAAIPTADNLVRNGLATLDESLFLDNALASTGMTDLLSEADFIRYQSSSPRPLNGIHALLAIDEAAILTVPDLIHRGWAPADRSPLSSPPASAPLPHPEWWHSLQCSTTQPVPIVPAPPSGAFEPVDLEIIPAPQLSSTSIEGTRFTLSWTPSADATDILQQAEDPLFASASVLYSGSSGVFTIYSLSPGDYYFRLRRQVGSISSDYSNGVAIRIESPASSWQILPAAAFSSQMMFDVQTSLLRMSAARGDFFALLSMPLHFTPSLALDYTAQLTSSAIEPAALSFGALYHPWITGREENDWSAIRTNPPDGAIAGVFAKRSSSRGPWISPANEPIIGAVALAPAIALAYRQQFQDAAINLIRQQPGGFLALCALTLSADDDLTPINVRRLLSFLRKTALREANDYVFEPNSPSFRRNVQSGFTNIMDQLFARGAFAGSTARQAYQIVLDDTINTPQAMDAGQFFVELKVAASLPMRFLTVRLLQTGDRTFVTEGN